MIYILNNNLCMTTEYYPEIAELLTIKRDKKKLFFMKKYNPFVKEIISFYYKHRYFNKGFLELIKKEFPNIKIIDKRKDIYEPKKIDTENIVQLRPYQKALFNTIKNKEEGIIYAATNAGKSFIMAKQIEYIGLPTLYVINRQVIMQQMKNFLEEKFKTKVGIINRDKYDIKDITVATIQTLIRREIPNRFKVLLIDEVHYAKAQTYQHLHKFTQFQFKYGYTGTLPKEKEELYRIISLVGIPYIKISNNDLINYNISAEPIILVKYFNEEIEAVDYIETKYKIRMNKERNKWIANIVNNKLKDKQVVIFVDSIIYGELLNSLIDNSYFLHGKINLKKREEIINKFKKRKIKKLITTWILQEGINIKNIEVFIFASTSKSHIRVLQFIGRVVRKTKRNKERVVIIDIVDNNKYMLKHWEERKKIYNKEQFRVEVIK